MTKIETTNAAPAYTRRKFLRGAGVALALPLLNQTQAKCADESPTNPKRMLLISNNLGVLPKYFFPTESGNNYEPSPYLSQLESLKKDFTVFSGLSHPAVEGGHSTENCFLTAAKNPTSSGFRNEISLDQYAADKLKRQTRFTSMNLGVNIDKANRSLSWTRDGSLIPAEDSATALFKKMFVQGTQAEVAARIDQLKKRGSILDVLSESTNQLSRTVGNEDKSRIDQYLTSIRELELRLHSSGEWETKNKPIPSSAPPNDVVDRALFFDKFEQMLSMAFLALQSDSTRIVTLMVDAFATPVFKIDDEHNSSTGYHNLSHHGMLSKNIEQLKLVDQLQLSLIQQLLVKLKETDTDAGNLLENTMVLYGSNMGDANTHDNRNLPILLAGGGFQHGQHLAFNRDKNAPLSNLFVSMLQQLGIEADQFGSSTSTLTGFEPTV